MAFDGIVIKTVTNELQKVIGYKIDKIYEPDKNTIVFGLYKNSINLNMLMCISSNNCRLHLTTHTQKNPLNAPNFCMLLRKHLIGFRIKRIYTIDLERIVFIDLENCENPNKPIFKKLIVELMGRHSNIILTDENNIIIDSMRHTSIEEKSNRDIYPTSRYIFPETKKFSFLELKDFEDFYSKLEPTLSKYITLEIQNIENLDISYFKIDEIISNTFNGISSSFVNNVIKELNIKELSKNIFKLIYDKIEQIINSNTLSIILTENNKDYYLYTSTENQSDDYKVNLQLDAFYYEKETSELFKNYRNSLLNLILATLKKYEKRLANIDNKLSECADKEKFRLYGELITSNLYQIPHTNLETIELENYYNNNQIITIPLNPKYSPAFNAKLYFKKYNKLKNALEIVNNQKQETIQDIDYMNCPAVKQLMRRN